MCLIVNRALTEEIYNSPNVWIKCFKVYRVWNHNKALTSPFYSRVPILRPGTIQSNSTRRPFSERSRLRSGDEIKRGLHVLLDYNMAVRYKRSLNYYNMAVRYKGSLHEVFTVYGKKTDLLVAGTFTVNTYPYPCYQSAVFRKLTFRKADWKVGS